MAEPNPLKPIADAVGAELSIQNEAAMEAVLARRDRILPQQQYYGRLYSYTRYATTAAFGTTEQSANQYVQRERTAANGYSMHVSAAATSHLGRSVVTADWALPCVHHRHTDALLSISTYSYGILYTIYTGQKVSTVCSLHVCRNIPCIAVQSGQLVARWR